MTTPASRSILTIGAGIAGVTTALEAADAGHDVVLIEREPSIGGRVLRNHNYFPKLCPPLCGMEINVGRIERNPRIRLMTETEVIAANRKAIRSGGGESITKCCQCGTCTAVCDLTTAEIASPRRQVQLARWGLMDELAADPAIWLCHQCNDCTSRCPKNARPGDVLQAVRAKVIERLAVPAVLGRLVAKANVTWPVLLSVPILFFVASLAITGHLAVPRAPFPHGDFAYELFVPHSLIYAVFIPTAGLVAAALWRSGWRFWTGLDGAGSRQGSFLASLWPVLVEIGTHRRFGDCGTAHNRKTGHLALVWGFIGAAVTFGLLIVEIYGMGEIMPLPLEHPFKLLGNLSAIFLVVDGIMLVRNRLAKESESGASTAFDSFFLSIVALVIFSGVFVEAGRFFLPTALNCALYVVHLGAVLCLFLTTPYSKSAHLLYRTLAMVHERMAFAPS